MSISLLAFVDRISKGHFEAHVNKFKEGLDEIIDIVEARGQKVLLSGISQNTKDLLEQLSSGYKKIKAKGLIFEKSEQGLNHLGVKTKKET